MRQLGPNLTSQVHLLVPLEASSKQPCPEKCWPLQAMACSSSGLEGPAFYSEQQLVRVLAASFLLQADVLMRFQ